MGSTTEHNSNLRRLH